MKQEIDLTEGSITKQLVRFFLPVAAGTWFQQLYNAVDAVIVGRYVGTEALAAVGGSAAMLINLLIGFFVALTGGASVVIAQCWGANKEKETAEAVGTAITFSLLIGAALSLVCTPAARFLLELLKTPADTLDGATSYLRICFSCAGIVLLLNTESSILRAVGDSRRPFIYMLLSCLLNIGLDLLFVIRFNLGVPGVAYATVLSEIVNFLLLTVDLLLRKGAYRLDLKKLRIMRGAFARMMHIGIPSGMQSAMYSISNTVLQGAVNTLGTVVVASWSLTGKLDGFYWATSNAAGIAVVTFIGQNFGAGRMDRVDECMKKSLKLFLIVTVSLSAIIVGIAPSALGLFSKDEAVLSTTFTIILYFVPFYFIWTFIEIISSVLRGCSDVTASTIITGLGICLFRVVWVFTAFRIRHTLFVVSISYLISWIITATALILYFRKGRWRTDPH